MEGSPVAEVLCSKSYVLWVDVESIIDHTLRQSGGNMARAASDVDNALTGPQVEILVDCFKPRRKEPECRLDAVINRRTTQDLFHVRLMSLQIPPFFRKQPPGQTWANLPSWLSYHGARGRIGLATGVTHAMAQHTIH